MIVNEIFLSIQGEAASTGYPTVFVRFTGCNLRCSFCDTTYSYNEGVSLSPYDVFNNIQRLFYRRICLTGGEPLLQEDMGDLLQLLKNYTVTIETNGSIPLDIVKLDTGHSFVMDMKTPSSGCSDKMMLSNFNLLTDRDEIKFVIGSRDDYEWSREIIRKRHKKGSIIFTPVFGKIDYADIVEWILNDRLDVRFMIQMHKIIWDPYRRGV